MHATCQHAGASLNVIVSYVTLHALDIRHWYDICNSACYMHACVDRDHCPALQLIWDSLSLTQQGADQQLQQQTNILAYCSSCSLISSYIIHVVFLSNRLWRSHWPRFVPFMSWHYMGEEWERIYNMNSRLLLHYLYCTDFFGDLQLRSSLVNYCTKRINYTSLTVWMGRAKIELRSQLPTQLMMWLDIRVVFRVPSRCIQRAKAFPSSSW